MLHSIKPEGKTMGFIGYDRENIATD